MYWKDRTAGHKYFENLDRLPAVWTTALIAFIKGHPELNWVRQIKCNNTVIVENSKIKEQSDLIINDISNGQAVFWRQLTHLQQFRGIKLDIRGTQRQLSENICLEDDLRSRIFGTSAVKFLS